MLCEIDAPLEKVKDLAGRLHRGRREACQLTKIGGEVDTRMSRIGDIEDAAHADFAQGMQVSLAADGKGYICDVKEIQSACEHTLRPARLARRCALFQSIPSAM